MENYIDMVRNHKEKAFQEGMEKLLNILIKNPGKDLHLPENPYKIKEKEGKDD